MHILYIYIYIYIIFSITVVCLVSWLVDFYGISIYIVFVSLCAVSMSNNSNSGNSI